MTPSAFTPIRSVATMTASGSCCRATASACFWNATASKRFESKLVSTREKVEDGALLVSVVTGVASSSSVLAGAVTGEATAATSSLPASITSTATATPTSRKAPQPIAANSGVLERAIGAAGGVGANGAGDSTA